MTQWREIILRPAIKQAISITTPLQWQMGTTTAPLPLNPFTHTSCNESWTGMWSTSRFRVGSAGQFPAWSTVALLDKDNNVYYTQSTRLTVINRLPYHCVNRGLIKVCVFFLTNIARRDIWRGLNYTQISQNNVLSKIDYPKPEDNGWQQQFIQYKRSSDWLTIVVTETYLTCSN